MEVPSLSTLPRRIVTIEICLVFVEDIFRLNERDMFHKNDHIFKAEPCHSIGSRMNVPAFNTDGIFSVLNAKYLSPQLSQVQL